jgi:hypothetical protein
MPIDSASRPAARSFHLHDGVVLFGLSTSALRDKLIDDRM